MQKAFSSKFIARKFSVSTESAIEFLANNGHLPIMCLDEVPYYGQESLDFIQAGVDAEQKWLKELKDLGYKFLNEVMCRDGLSPSTHFPPLEKFIEEFQDLPEFHFRIGDKTDYKSERAREYWASVEAWKDRFEFRRAIRDLPEQDQHMLTNVYDDTQLRKNGRKFTGKEFREKIAAFDFTPYAELITKFGLRVE